MAIGIELATPTVCPDTNKTQLGSDVVLPTTAKSILAVVPFMVGSDVTLLPHMAYVSLESDDLPTNIAPYEVLLPPIGTGITATEGSVVIPSLAPRYPLNVSVKGGERIRVYGTPYIDVTALDQTIGCALILSTNPISGTQKHAKVGALGTVGAAEENIEISGGTVTINGAHRLCEVMGIAAALGSTSLESVIGSFRLASSGFQPNIPLKYPFAGYGGGGLIAGGSNSTTAAGMERFEVDVGMSSPITIENFCTIIMATMSLAQNFAVGIVYE